MNQPWITTAAQFFKDTVPALLSASGAPALSLPAPAVFQIGGKDGGVWSIDVDNKTVIAGQVPPPVSVIVKAEERDFMALVEGRMSAADGVLTGRLSLSGDVAAIAALMEALTAAGSKDP